MIYQGKFPLLQRSGFLGSAVLSFVIFCAQEKFVMEFFFYNTYLSLKRLPKKLVSRAMVQQESYLTFIIKYGF